MKRHRYVLSNISKYILHQNITKLYEIHNNEFTYENHAIPLIFVQDVYFKKQIVCVNIDVPM